VASAISPAPINSSTARSMAPSRGTTRSVGTGRDPLDFVRVQPDVGRQDAVLLPLVGRATDGGTRRTSSSRCGG